MSEERLVDYPMGNLVEVREVRSYRETNLFLEAGYRLVAVHQLSSFIDREGQGPPQGYVRRFTQYIVGRTADIGHFEPPPREQLRPA